MLLVITTKDLASSDAVLIYTAELLLRDGGIPLLLGGRGSGAEGSLRRFIPDPQSQRNLLMEAARQCQESGFHDKVVSVC